MPFVGWDGMDGMVVIGHRSSKSTSGANNGERKEGKYLDKENLLSAVKMKKEKGKKENIWRGKMSFFAKEEEKFFCCRGEEKWISKRRKMGKYHEKIVVDGCTDGRVDGDLKFIESEVF